MLVCLVLCVCLYGESRDDINLCGLWRIIYWEERYGAK